MEAKLRNAVLGILVIAGLMTATPSTQAAQMIGYLADGSGGMTLGQVPTSYDIVIIAAAQVSGTDNATMLYSPQMESPSQLVTDIQTAHSRGQKVLISLYSGNNPPYPNLALLTNNDVKSFIDSVQSIVSAYGFDGIDLDFEDATLGLNPGDNDLYHPTTPTVVNLIAALHTIKHNLPNLMITMPPESESCNGYSFFGDNIHSGWTSGWGNDEVFLTGIRDILTMAFPQEYLGLSAPYYGLDGVDYSNSGNPSDFWASQMELMIKGYPVSTGQNYPGLAPSQIALGITTDNPASAALAAIQYIGSGTSYGGQYVLRDINGYPDVGGIMIWNINDDDGYDAGIFDPYLHSIGGTNTTSTDYLNDWSIISSRTANWTLDTSGAAYTNGDKSVAVRTAADIESITYKFTNMVSFNARVYVNQIPISSVQFSSSTDGVNFEPVAVDTGNEAMTTAGWGYYDIIPQGPLPADTIAIEITFTQPNGISAYNEPALSQVSITYPGPVTLPKATAPGLTATTANEEVSLSWSGVSAATTYSVYRGTSPGGEDSVPIASRLIGTTYVDSNAPTNPTPLVSGKTYYYTVKAVNAGGTSAASNEVAPVFVVQSAYGSAPAVIPGLVQADNYDAGGSGFGYYSGGATTNPGGKYRNDGVDIVTCTDPASNRGNGYNVTDTAAGHWLRYTVNAAEAGQYTMTFRVASATGGTFHLRDSNGISLTDPITVPSTGGPEKWQTVGPVSLILPDPFASFYYIPAGQQIVELHEDSGTFSIENMTFTLLGPDTPINLSATAGSGNIFLYWLPYDSSNLSPPGALAPGSVFNIYRGSASGEESSMPLAYGVTASPLNTGSIFTDANVRNGTTYYYTVAAVNSSGTSPMSAESIAAPNSGASTGSGPLPPTGLTATAGNETVRLAWSTTAGADSYNIYAGTEHGEENGIAAMSGITGTSVMVAGLANGRTYYFRVEGFNGFGPGEASAEVSATPIPPAPAPPATVTAGAGDEQIVLNWSAVATATSYNVYRGAVSNGESGTPIGKAASTSFTNTGLANGTTYYYRVKAVNLGGTSKASEEAWATPKQAIPTPPTGLTATGGDDQISLKWMATVGATSYNVYRGTSTGGESGTPIATKVAATSFTNAGLTAGKTYYYTVKAVNSLGTSKNSNEAAATAKLSVPAPPTNLTAMGTSGEVKLTWDSSAGATSYNVCRGTTPAGESPTPIKSVATTSYTNIGLNNSVTYYYVVKAVSSVGTSKNSNQASAKP